MNNQVLVTNIDAKLSKVKVGDRLYCLDVGRVEVVSVNLDVTDPKDEYICLKALDKTDAAGLPLFRDCDSNGRYCTEDVTPSVYFSKPIIIDSPDISDSLGPVANLFLGEDDSD